MDLWTSFIFSAPLFVIPEPLMPSKVWRTKHTYNILLEALAIFRTSMDQHGTSKRQRIVNMNNNYEVAIIRSVGPYDPNKTMVEENNYTPSLARRRRRAIMLSKKNGNLHGAVDLNMNEDPKYKSYIARQRRREIISKKRNIPLKNTIIFHNIGGQNVHRIGSLLPYEGFDPKFSQLYIYEPDLEVEHRRNAVSEGKSNVLDPSIIDDLKQMIDIYNPYGKTFRMVADRISHDRSIDVKLRLIGSRSRDGREYNMPTTSEVAALIVGDFESISNKRDLIIQKRSGQILCIDEFLPSYLPLQYPLLFIYGEDGYYSDISHAATHMSKRNKLTLREFLAFRIQDRENEGQQLLLARRLLQQFMVDGYTMMETQRLQWIRHNQPTLRSERYNNLNDLKAKGNCDTIFVGRPYILPSSFTGGKRYMIQNYQDAMAICRWTRYPSLFITFTCNPKWPEITRFMNKKGLRPEDRQDISVRVFKMKLDELIKDLKQERIFGEHTALVATIEFQKRGLPHAHIIIFLKREAQHHLIQHIDDLYMRRTSRQKSGP